MFTLNLGWARSGEPSTFERLSWTVPPAPAAMRSEGDPAATVPEKPARGSNWFTSFERMLAAYADLAIRDLRE